MTSNGVNAEDADMAECDGEKVVTMMDVLQEQQEFEEDANAVLGASDDNNCTYSKGYIKRQALYACLTCCGDAREDPSARAGVCLACSLTCHENHDLIELYTKRNFRCDCGNPKFQHPCTYTQNKTQLNDENHYDQNFSGLYCICHRPYPDPDGIEEEMIQCIICEDWLHASHLEATIPSSDCYAEMICKACMEKNEFLHDYSEFAVNGDVDVVNLDENDKSVRNEGNKIGGVVEEGCKDAEVNDKVENKPKDEIKEDDLQHDIDSTKINASLANNNIDHTEQKNKTVENCKDAECLEIESKPNENETEIATAEELTVEKPGSDEEISIRNTEVENTKADVSTSYQVSENNKTTDSSTTEAIEAVNTDGSSKDENTKADVDMVSENNKTTDSSTTEAIEAVNTDGSSKDENTKADVDMVSENNKTIDNSTTEAIETVNTDGSSKDEIKVGIDTEIQQDESSLGVPLETVSSNDNTVDNKEESSNEIEEGQQGETNETRTATEVETKTDEAEAKINETETNSGDVDTAEEKKEASNGHSDTMPSEQANNLDKPLDSSESNDNSSSTQQDIEMDVSTNVVNNKTTEAKEHKRKLSTEDDDVSVKKPKIEGKMCIRPKSRKMFKGATFWPSHFRQKLCTCNECIKMYTDLAVLFLIDPEDTVTAYETLGKEQTNGTSSTSSYEKGLEALSSLGRIQQINAVTEYNKMRDKLLDFLKSFKDRKEVVKEEDIKTFFANMKPKREPDGVYFCR